MSNLVELNLLLGAIDHEISLLAERRQEIAGKIADAEERSVMRVKAAAVASILCDISKIDDPVVSLNCAVTHLQPFRESLPCKHFGNMHSVWPEILPPAWTRGKATEFFTSLNSTLECDIEAFDAWVSLE